MSQVDPEWAKNLAREIENVSDEDFLAALADVCVDVTGADEKTAKQLRDHAAQMAKKTSTEERVRRP